MKIIVDAFGGDNAPLEILKGCAQAAAEYDLDVMLTGREAEIRRVAEENEISLDRMELVDTPDIITMEDHAGDIMKSKSQSSMAEGLRQLAAAYPGHVAEDTGRVPAQETKPNGSAAAGCCPGAVPGSGQQRKKET